MIYIVDKKFFMKKAKKLVEPADYFIIDGEDTGSTLSSGTSCISDKYSHSITNGKFTPPSKLFRLLHNDSKKFNADRVDDMIDEYMNDKHTISALLSAAKAMFYDEKNNPKGLNIFIVLPNKIYKVFGKLFKDWYKDKFKEDFVYLKADIKESDFKMLEDGMKGKTIESVKERISKLEKKYKLIKKKKDKKKHKHDKDDFFKKDKDKKKKKKKHKGKKSDFDSIEKRANIDTWSWF